MMIQFDEKPWKKEEYEIIKKSIKKEKKLTGEEIRSILIKKYDSVYLVATEKNYTGVNNAPLDLVLGDKKTLGMVGFEIKGDTDTFQRLPHQLREYFFVCDGVYIVVHKKEPPEWLPSEVGIIRVSTEGKIYEENSSYMRNPLDISTDYEWEALFKSNHLGKTSKRTKEILDVIAEIRKNILFNRYFAVQGEWNTYKFKKFYPFTEEQRAIIIGFDIPQQYKLIMKDLADLEKRVDILKKLTFMGQQTLSDNLKEGKR